MKNKRIIIKYDSIEYDCCGTVFSVGDIVCWNISKSDEIIKTDKGTIKIDYHCNNCFGGEKTISGKIEKITMIVNNELIDCKISRKTYPYGVDYLIYLKELK